jgi:hypothetical protein
MKNMKNLLATITLSLGALAAFAQEPLDGAYQKVVTKEKEVIPYDFIREADVFWSKRIWRSIDVREKMNLPFKYPQQYLIEIIHSAAKNGELTVYDNSVVDGDQFKQVLACRRCEKNRIQRGYCYTNQPGNHGGRNKSGKKRVGLG